MARPDALVFPLVAADRLVLLHPFPGVADIHSDAVSLWDADRDVVRRVCPDKVDAIPEGHLGLMDAAVEKLAGREPRLADVVPAHLVPAWALCPERLAWDVPEKRSARPREAAALCTPDAAQSAA